MQPDQREDTKALVAWILEAARRSMVHYGLWFNETAHQTGLEAALKLETEAGDRWLGIFLKRLSRVLDFELEDGLPAPLLNKDPALLDKLAEAVSLGWLALDGVWFQALENSRSMFDAQRANDTCWTRFSPYEANRIRTLAGLPEAGGLDALKRALDLRLYARINTQEIVEESDTSFLFVMRECRVQSARQRKGLAPYPCKQGGLMEYRHFAWEIDSRIKTECVACPPDPLEEGRVCAWRFTLDKD